MMDAENKPVSLRKIASWLNVPWSTVQYKPNRQKPPRIDVPLERQIHELIQQPNYASYGYRRITALLKQAGQTVNKKKVQRIMHINGWGVARKAKGFRPRVAASSSKSARINQRWATDMTHFFCQDVGWCHLVPVMDCWNREIVGYRISRRQNTAVAEGALEDALLSRYGRNKAQSRGLILRSDNGLIFSSKAFLRLVNKYGLTPEYITPYTPEQNGMMERFMRTIKTECIWLNSFSSFAQAQKTIAAWIDFYNNERQHSALGYLAPVQFRNKQAA